MGLRRLELQLGSSVSRLFAGAAVNNSGGGTGTVNVTWDNISVAWNAWAVAWDSDAGIGVTWDAMGIDNWNVWSLVWGA